MLIQYILNGLVVFYVCSVAVFGVVFLLRGGPHTHKCGVGVLLSVSCVLLLFTLNKQRTNVFCSCCYQYIFTTKHNLTNVSNIVVFVVSC